MPVSTARVREIRQQLDDAARDLAGDDHYAELADVVGQAAEEFDSMVDERGQMTEAAPVQVGSRVKRTDDAPADEPAPDDMGVTDEPDSPDAPAAKKRKLPPQFSKSSR